MRTVGIKLADGSFYPIMEEGTAQKKTLELTTAHNNQTCVMVDLYRSKTCSMDDAEYIDTLKIENLNEHPNGEPSISFDVDLNEDGELSYAIADPETGTSSNSEITLVSRTVEERLQADDYSIEETPAAEEPAQEESSGNGAAVAAGVVAGAGLMAAAAALSNNKNEEEDAPAEPEGLASFTDADAFADLNETEAGDETLADDATIAEEPLPDFDEAPSVDDTTLADEPLPDFDETPVTDDATLADDSLLDFDKTPASDDATIAEDSLPDFDEAPASDDATIAEDSLPDFDEAPASDDATIAEDSLPDFDENSLPSEETTITDDNFAADDATIAEEPQDSDFDMPEDFSVPDGLTEDTTFSEASGFADTAAKDPLFNEAPEDLDFDEQPSPAPAAGGMDFSGLYDKETEMGNSSENQDDDIKKKTRAPVIICIVCAIICLIATALVLLVLPTKFNLRLKHSQKKQETAVEKPAEQNKGTEAQPVQEKKPEPVPQAKEDEVVVIEKAEEVKPLPPPAPETKPAGVTYKIKWGDTLWDIADTYYKNPWRYKKIANYNNIKNPDYIISGTVITIPAE